MIKTKKVIARVEHPGFVTTGKVYEVEVLPSDTTGTYAYESYRVPTDDGSFRVMKSIHFEEVK